MIGCTVDYSGSFKDKEQSLTMQLVSLSDLRSSKDPYKILHSCVKHNLKVVNHILDNFSRQDYALRMVRLSLDILPLFSNQNQLVRSYYESEDFEQHAKTMHKLGLLAKSNSIKISFHAPYDYALLSSNEHLDHVVSCINTNASIVELLGFDKFMEVKITHHLVGKHRHISELPAILKRLSPSARNSFVLENDLSYGLDDLIEYHRHVPIVIDLHHHWLKTGEHLKEYDDRVLMVADSWRGKKPTLHYSLSEEHRVELNSSGMPDLKKSMRKSSMQQLQKHSAMMWCSAANIQALKYFNYFDILCEASGSFMAAYDLFDFGETQCITNERPY